MNALDSTIENGQSTIAFPAILSENNQSPMQASAQVACQMVYDFLMVAQNKKQMDRIVFCVPVEALAIYEKELRVFFPDRQSLLSTASGADRSRRLRPTFGS